MAFLNDAPAAGLAPQAAAPPETKVGSPYFSDLLGSALDRDTTIGSAAVALSQPAMGPHDPKFDPFDRIQGYEDHAASFIGANSDEDVYHVKSRIDAERRREDLLNSGGWRGLLAEAIAGVADPVNLVPIGGEVKALSRGAEIGQAAFRLGRAGLLSSTAQEAVLQATQETRTGKESLANVAAATVFSGLLGGAIGAFGRPVTRDVATSAMKGGEIFDRELGGNIGAANENMQFGSVGAARRVDTTLEQEGFSSALGAEKGLAFASPTMRLGTSPSVETRRVGQALADQPLEVRKNLEGIETPVSAESRIRLWQAPLAESLTAADDLFVQYRLGREKRVGDQLRIGLGDMFGKPSGVLSHNEFMDAVGQAMRRGDKSDIPEVAQAAKTMREKLFDPLKEQAIKAGLLPEDVSVDTALSYLTRVYNVQRIAARRPEFEGRLVKWLDGARGEVADRVAKFKQTLSASETRKTKLEADLPLKEARLGAVGPEADKLDRQFTRMDRDLKNADRTHRRAFKAQQDAEERLAKFTPTPVDEGAPTGFRTAKGSTYETHADGTTTRNKAFRQEHGEAEQGPQPRSQNTVYVTKEEANALSIFQATNPNGEMIVAPLGDGRWGVKMTTGNDAGKFLRDTVVTPKNAPAKGLLPIEVWNDGARVHFGNEITQVTRAPAEQSALWRNKDHDLPVTLVDEPIHRGPDGREYQKVIFDGKESFVPADELIKPTIRDSTVASRAKAREIAFNARRAKGEAETAAGKVREKQAEWDRLKAASEAAKLETASLRAEVPKLQAELRRHTATVDSLTKKIEGEQAFAGLGELDLKDMARQITDNLLHAAPARSQYTPVPLTRGPLRERTLNIPDKDIEDFLESDVGRVARIYTRTMGSDVELSKAFGRADLSDQMDKIREHYAVLREGVTDEKRLSKLDKQMQGDLRDIAAVRDRLRGNYGLPENPNGLWNRSYHFVRDLNYLRLMGGMTISSLPDLGTAVMAHGFLRLFGDGFVPMVRSFSDFRLSAGEVKRGGTALDMVLDGRAMSLADVMDDYGRWSKFERGMQAFSNHFGLVSLIAPWTASLKQIVGVVSQTRTLEAIEALAAGTIKSTERTRLASMGIAPDMAERIGAMYAQHGEKRSGVRWANTTVWEDKDAADVYRAALSKEVDMAVVTPGQERPLWMTKGMGRVIGQFHSFSIASTQRILLAGLQRRDMATLNGFAMMTALGALATYIKASPEQIEKVKDNPGWWVKEGLDRGGMAGWLFDVNNIVEKMTRNAVGVSRLTGGPTASRYASRGVLESVLGPTAGLVNDTAQAIGAASARDWSAADTSAVRKMIPLQNLIGLKKVFDQAESGVNRSLGVPDKKH